MYWKLFVAGYQVLKLSATFITYVVNHFNELFKLNHISVLMTIF